MRALLPTVCGLWLLAPTSGRELSTSAFGGVFLAGEEVLVTAGEGAPTTLLLRDYEGREVARREAPAAGPVNFGRLTPGYWEVVAGETVQPLVVVVDPARRVAGDSRLATDNAMAWLVNPEQFARIADLLTRCGVSFVRERLSWGEVERERGQYNWDNRYGRSLRALADRGVRVYNVFHSTPGWSRADRNTKAACDDLRDIYRFARELATRWRGTITAWEVWNEPDIGFFSHPSGELAAFQKAAYLGYKAVDPEVTVLGPSIAWPPCDFSAGLLANGLGDYLDAWNYHIYADATAYAGRADSWRRQLAEFGVVKPLWVTEAGDRVSGPNGVLTPANRRHQAAFLSRAYPSALAAGVERHFWFIFPFYREGDIGWGLFEPNNQRPFPGVAALATATYALGRGDYLGRLKDTPEGVRALAFDRGDETACLTIWRTGEPAEATLSLTPAAVREAVDHLGRPLTVGPGNVTLRLGDAAVYLLLAPDTLAGRLEPPVAPAPVAPAAAPELPEVVTRLTVAEARIDKDTDTYVLGAGQTVTLGPEVYNFGATALRGTLKLTVPVGLTVDRTEWPIELPPGERWTGQATLRAPRTWFRERLRLVFEAAGRRSSPAQVTARLDLNEAEALAERPLDLDDPARWRNNIAGHGQMTITPGPEGGVKFGFVFRGQGDPWAYPQAPQNPPLDLSASDGLRFEYRTTPADAGVVRAMLVETDGTMWLTSNGLPGSAEWRSVTIPWDAFSPWSKPADGHGPAVAASRITVVRVGCNCKPAEVTLEVRGLRAIRWTER